MQKRVFRMALVSMLPSLRLSPCPAAPEVVEGRDALSANDLGAASGQFSHMKPMTGVEQIPGYGVLAPLRYAGFSGDQGQGPHEPHTE
ncbi:hypothetical protein PX699_10000 [Sphingobium sp. H39-3-25]|uniref:hypothetical protein n=1 Tax=Sphingobium arseniciresistens TaxID=3030834 RepID=UPI0023B9BCEB|nr:hypothetical protein [Sphingobium arseniciresistens]